MRIALSVNFQLQSFGFLCKPASFQVQIDTYVKDDFEKKNNFQTDLQDTGI